MRVWEIDTWLLEQQRKRMVFLEREIDIAQADIYIYTGAFIAAGLLAGLSVFLMFYKGLYGLDTFMILGLFTVASYRMFNKRRKSKVARQFFRIARHKLVEDAA